MKFKVGDKVTMHRPCSEGCSSCEELVGKDGIISHVNSSKVKCPYSVKFKYGWNTYSNFPEYCFTPVDPQLYLL